MPVVQPAGADQAAVTLVNTNGEESLLPKDLSRTQGNYSPKWICDWQSLNHSSAAIIGRPLLVGQERGFAGIFCPLI
jgi:hypothetical protein